MLKIVERERIKFTPKKKKRRRKVRRRKEVITRKKSKTESMKKDHKESIVNRKSINYLH